MKIRKNYYENLICEICNKRFSSYFLKKTCSKECLSKHISRRKLLNKDFAKNLAKERNGECLSEEYNGYYKILKWKCKNGHIFENTYCNIRGGSWCPKCKIIYKSEAICRNFFEYIFNKKFNKIRPSWLKTKNNSYLELDGFCEELKLAFEYNGEGHYKKDWKQSIIKDDTRLEYSQNNDKLKKKLCKKNNVRLIIVPYYINYNNMEEYIISRCKEQNIMIPFYEKINYKNFDINDKDMLDDVIKYVKEKGGKCLSEIYINANQKLKIQCNKGHIWEVTRPSLIYGKKWCPYCAKNKKHTIDEIKLLINEKKGNCLTDIYINHLTKIKVQCKNNHIWETRASNLFDGCWCPYCARNRIWISDI